MKRLAIITTCFASLLLLSCKKDAATAEVRYEITTTNSAAYTVSYAVNSSAMVSDAFTGTVWTKTIAEPRESGGAPTIARLTLFPPAAWAGTSNSSNVSLKIYVNGNIADQTTEVMTAAHINVGVFAIASF